MPRVKRGTISHRRHKKLFKAVKGYRGKNKNTVALGRLARFKAGQHSYESRRLRKRDFHTLWIARLNAICRENGLNYSRFIYGLELCGILLNRKMLADLAAQHPEAFMVILNEVKEVLPPVGQAPDVEKLKERILAKKSA